MNLVETCNCASLYNLKPKQMNKNSNLYQKKYRISEARLKGFDYGSNAIYFITICTKNRENYFGDIIVETRNCASLQMSEIGQIANNFWSEIPQHFPFVELDDFVIMPNHIHGILVFNKENYNEWNINKFGVQSQNLASVIRAFKSSVKRYSNQNNIDFNWQSRYYDRIVRNYDELKRIQIYIQKNPENWKNDEFNQT